MDIPITITGRVADPIETGQTKDGRAVLSFKLWAKPNSRHSGTCWHIRAFGPPAAAAATYITNGVTLIIVGHPTVTDDPTGTRQRVELVASRIAWDISQ